MTHFDKHFTVSEANALLPEIRQLFYRIFSLIEEAQKLQTPITLSGLITPGRTNGKHQNPARTKEEILEAINRILTEITDQGIVVQDVSRGLIDFPCILNGEEVFLCYELNDGDTLQYWHNLNAGYAGRKPLPEKFL